MQQQKRRLISPLQIIKNNQQRSFLRNVSDKLRNRLKKTVTLTLRTYRYRLWNSAKLLLNFGNQLTNFAGIKTDHLIQ